MFIADNDVIDIVIFYKKLGRTYVTYSEKDFNVDEKIEDKDKYKKITVSMKILTWNLYNDLQDAASVFDPMEGRNKFNFRKYKEEKLKRLIVKWDATTADKDGNQIPVPVNDKNILSLAPSIAETLLSDYDDLSIMDTEEEKK